MEIAKFIFTCVSIGLAIFGTIAGLWRAHNKKVSAQIASVEKGAREKILSAEKDAQEKIISVESKIEDLRVENGKRIDSLEDEVRDLQKVVSEGFQQRLSNIEGEMKGMSNILKQIQGWFISNTPKGHE